jgi:hypothetical protein
MNLDRKEVTVKNLSFQKNSKNLLFFFFFCLLEQSYIFVEHDFSPSRFAACSFGWWLMAGADLF